jgi:hypothetical protein
VFENGVRVARHRDCDFCVRLWNLNFCLGDAVDEG